MYSFSFSATSFPRKIISTAPFAPITATSPDGHLSFGKGPVRPCQYTIRQQSRDSAVARMVAQGNSTIFWPDVHPSFVRQLGTELRPLACTIIIYNSSLFYGSQGLEDWKLDFRWPCTLFSGTGLKWACWAHNRSYLFGKAILKKGLCTQDNGSDNGKKCEALSVTGERKRARGALTRNSCRPSNV